MAHEQKFGCIFLPHGSGLAILGLEVSKLLVFKMLLKSSFVSR